MSSAGSVAGAVAVAGVLVEVLVEVLVGVLAGVLVEDASGGGGVDDESGSDPHAAIPTTATNTIVAVRVRRSEKLNAMRIGRSSLCTGSARV